jgi:small-conductance mechanosensitive channel
MFQRIADDFKEQTAAALRLTSLAAGAAIALFITIAFLCAAAFIAVLRKYGAIEACLTGAAIFFVVTLVVAGSYMVRRRATRRHAQAAAQSVLADPMVVTAGLQLLRTVGIKKLLPLLAVGGLALGLMVNRNHASDQTPAE